MTRSFTERRKDGLDFSVFLRVKPRGFFLRFRLTGNLQVLQAERRNA